ncbi:MAG: cupin domain-containing protein, partial [Candidatus Zixiibacteriota bacterium]
MPLGYTHRIDLSAMPWNQPAPGIRHKVFSDGRRRLRLVELTEEFRDPDWCTREHAGYLLEGRMSIHFDGEVIDLKAGDAFLIPAGREHRHRAQVLKGHTARLVLVEEDLIIGYS